MARSVAEPYRSLALRNGLRGSHGESRRLRRAGSNPGAKIIPCLHTNRPLEYAKNFAKILQQHGPYDCVHSHVHHYSGYVRTSARRSSSCSTRATPFTISSATRASVLHSDDEGRAARTARRGRHQHARREPVDHAHSRDVRPADRASPRRRPPRRASPARRTLGARALWARRLVARDDRTARRRHSRDQRPRGDREFYFSFTSFLQPPAIYRYDLETRTVDGVQGNACRTRSRNSRRRNFLHEQGWNARADVHHGATWNQARGSHPTLLAARSVQRPATPVFSAESPRGCELGGIYAVANVRGGGEYGRAWHARRRE